jgi:hypothetical protein
MVFCAFINEGPYFMDTNTGSTIFPTAGRPVPACFSDGYRFFYEIKSGDTFNEIITSFYGPIDDQIRNLIVQKVKKDNPDITDINKIYAGHLLYLELPFRNEVGGLSYEREAAIRSIKQTLSSLSPNEREVVGSLQSSKGLFTLVSGVLTFSGGCLGGLEKNIQSMRPAIDQMIDNYTLYAKGNIKKHAYQSTRQKILSTIQHKSLYRQGQFKLTPTQGRQARKILASTPRTKSLGLFAKEIEAGAKFSKYAKYGGIATNVIEIAGTGYRVYSTDNKRERNELIVGQMGSTTGGLVGGTVGGAALMTISAFLAATPAGWVVIVVGGVSAVVGSISGEFLSRSMYSKSCQYGKPFFVDTLNSEWICP